MEPKSEKPLALIAIKLIHTAIWLFFAGCIVAIPVAAAQRHFRNVLVSTGLVLLECAVLAFNHGRCPLTDFAARFTPDRQDNFDIYLPLCLARHNKLVFGTLFALAELFAGASWLWF